MDLFEYMKEETKKKNAPLASRMRPTCLSQVKGQDKILGAGKMLRRLIEADRLGSIILYGPPGTGKTTLAKVIAGTTSSLFVQINATVAGKKDMERVVARAEEDMGIYGKKTILFVDEIHRFNKSQQDYLLPFVEDGTITLIGATTENPYFEVNGALLSRSDIYQLESLGIEDIKALLLEAIEDKERGLGNQNLWIEPQALDYLAQASGGDARRALNALEIASMTTQGGGLTLEIIKESIQKRVITYDKNGDNHYDTISAFIKSMRGSDPDATIFYLSKMLEAGEDSNFIARRLMIAAAEDVGLADPNALVIATNAALALERVGLPEGRIILSQAALYIALAPKSNSAYIAIDRGLELARQVQTTTPVHLKDSHYSGAKSLGHGLDYLYPHNFENHYVAQEYLPKEIINTPIYTPVYIGIEEKMNQYKDRITSQYKK